MPARIDFETKDVNYIIKSYRDGWSMTVLAEEFSVSVPAIRRVLVDAKVTIKSRGRYANA